MKPAFSLFLIALFSATSARAIEPYANRNLPVTRGLAVWLDAASEERAQASAGMKPGERQSHPRLLA